jgi:hypothetical protein
VRPLFCNQPETISRRRHIEGQEEIIMAFDKTVVVGFVFGLSMVSGCAGAQAATRMSAVPGCAVAQVVDPMPDNQRGSQVALAGAGKVVSAQGEAARGNAMIPGDAPQAVAPVDQLVARGNPADSCAAPRQYAQR